MKVEFDLDKESLLILGKIDDINLNASINIAIKLLGKSGIYNEFLVKPSERDNDKPSTESLSTKNLVDGKSSSDPLDKTDRTTKKQVISFDSL
jgi:hypothetical protein